MRSLSIHSEAENIPHLCNTQACVLIPLYYYHFEFLRIKSRHYDEKKTIRGLNGFLIANAANPQLIREKSNPEDLDILQKKYQRGKRILLLLIPAQPTAIVSKYYKYKPAQHPLHPPRHRPVALLTQVAPPLPLPRPVRRLPPQQVRPSGGLEQGMEGWGGWSCWMSLWGWWVQLV